MSARRQQGSDGAKPVSTSRSMAALCASRGSGSLFLPLPVLHVLSQTGLKGAVSPTRVWVVLLTSPRAQPAQDQRFRVPDTWVWVVVLTSLRAQVSPGLKVPCPRHLGLGRAFFFSC